MQEAVQETFSHERVETELIQLLYSAMENLPGECRKIFQLYLDDQTTAEIANHLQISTATVRSQKRRAIQLLKHWMAERWPGKVVILWYISMHFKDLSPLHYFFFMFLHTQPS
jgi:DNA-directed RNA polymerase specialized sigma24 family protein